MKRRILISESALVEIIQDIVVKEQAGLLRKAGQIIRKAFKGSADDTTVAASKGSSGNVVKSTTDAVTRNAKDHLKRLVNNVTELEQKFSKESVDELAEFLNTSMIEGKTIFRNDAGNAFIYSASGRMWPIDQLQGFLYLAGREGADIAHLANTLPRQLAGNPPIVFRDDIVEILTKGAKTSTQKVGTLPIGNLGNKFKQQAATLSGWMQPKLPVGNLSGWKFHVYADTLDEVAFLYERLLPLADKWGAGFKVATEGMLKSLSVSPIQRGKGVTLYLPSSVVDKGAQRTFLSDIQSAIKGYNKTGNISGDKMITPNIGYRYELSKPINPKVGVPLSTYKELYQANTGGGHNIAGNIDLFY